MRSQSHSFSSTPRRSRRALIRTAALVVGCLGIASAEAGLDAGFGTGGTVVTDFGGRDDQAYAMVLQPNGKIVVVGRSGGNFAAARYRTDGRLDRTFGVDGKVVTNLGTDEDEARSVVIQPDGKILVAGRVGRRLRNAANHDFAVVRYLRDGKLDRSFGVAGIVISDFGGGRDFGRAIALQPDGGFVVAGESFSRPIHGVMVARYHADGRLDERFGTKGRVLLEDGQVSRTAHGPIWGSNAVIVQPDGKIVAAGSFDGVMMVFRLHPNGKLDASFGESGRASATQSGDSPPGLAMQSDGSILVAGISTSYFCRQQHTDASHNIACLLRRHKQMSIFRITRDGNRDDSFNSVRESFFVGDPHDGPRLLVQPDEKILVAGSGRPPFVTGTPLVPEATISLTGYAIDGAISIGSIERVSTQGGFSASRYLKDGLPDDSFGDGGKIESNFPNSSLARSVALQTNGKILLAGLTQSDFALVRFEAEGNPGAADLISHQPDNHIGVRGRNLKGDGIYQGIPSRRRSGPQAIRISRKGGRPADFYFAVENDGQAADTLLVRPSISGTGEKLRVRQLTPTNQNVTAAFASNRLFLQNRQPGAKAKFRVRTTAGRRAGQSRRVTITTISLTELSRRDSVHARVDTAR